jgi:predicted RND superfamily exporter protein
MRTATPYKQHTVQTAHHTNSTPYNQHTTQTQMKKTINKTRQTSTKKVYIKGEKALWRKSENKTKPSIIIIINIIIIIIIITHVITFMHGICNYIPQTNHVSTVHSVAAVLYLQFVLHVMLFRP